MIPHLMARSAPDYAVVHGTDDRFASNASTVRGGKKRGGVGVHEIVQRTYRSHVHVNIYAAQVMQDKILGYVNALDPVGILHVVR